MSLLGDNTTRDEILEYLTKAHEIVDAIAKVAEVAFPEEALAIAGADFILDRTFDLAVKLTGNTETLDAMRARMRENTLEAIKAVPAVP